MYLFQLFQVYAREGSPKKISIQDSTSSAVLTVWPPHHNIKIKEGDDVTPCDCRVTSFNNDLGFDTSAGSLIEMSISKALPLYNPCFCLYLSISGVKDKMCVSTKLYNHF